MKTQCITIALVAALIAVAQACGGDDNGGSDGAADAGRDPNKVQPGQICDRLATIQCAGEADCCDNPDRDLDECKQAQKSFCSDELLIDTLAANPIIGFDANAAEKAFTEFERKVSKCDTSVAAWGSSMDGMRGILKGTVEPGQSCKPTNKQDTAATYAALGSCKDGANNVCLPISEDVFTCSPRSDVGGSCYTDLNCTEGLFCDNPNMDLTGSTCAPRKTVGTACGSANECETLYCNKLKRKCADADKQTVYCL